MTTRTESGTQGAAFAANPAVDAAIENVVNELRVAQARITTHRPADPELRTQMEADLDAFTVTKGRGPYFPYLGSGIGNGPLVELVDGSVKWDMITGIGVHVFGHGDPELVRLALRASTTDALMQGNLQYNRETIAFSELLLREARRDSSIAHCFLTNSGVMANESALKVCHQFAPGSERVVAFVDCFMGRSMTMAQIGDSAGARQGLPLSTLVDYVPFYDPTDGAGSTERSVAILRSHVHRYPGKHACFVMELVQGEGGFNKAPREFFVALAEVCREAGIVLWADEVQTFGRTESLFHYQQHGLGEYVDIVTLGKMSQVCACLYSERLNPKPGLLSGTFVGSTTALVVGRRIIERLIEDGHYGPEGRNAALHAVFCSHAQKLVDRFPQHFPSVPRTATPYGGVGGMMRLSPFGGERKPVRAFLDQLFEDGVMGFPCGHGPYHVRFLPPIGVLQPEHLEEVFEIITGTMERFTCS